MRDNGASRKLPQPNTLRGQLFCDRPAAFLPHATMHEIK